MKCGGIGAVLCLAVALCAFPGEAWGQCENEIFKGFVSYPAGVMPDGVVAAELNGDERLDLILAGDGVQVLLGLPGGAFGPPTIYQTGSPFTSVATGDIDEDGDIDVVAAQSGSLVNRGVRILLNDGSGALSVPIDLFLPDTTDIQGVALGDMNGDDHLDIVIADYGAQRIVIWLNDGFGGFATHTAHSTPGSRPYDLKLVNMDGDSDLDVVTANQQAGGISPATGSLKILLNDGAGHFPFLHYLTPFACLKLDHGDLDGDGDQDIVMTCANGSMRIYSNTGTGAVDEPAVVIDTALSLYAVVLADYDLDGDLDAAITHRFGSAMSMYLNNGSGALQFLEETAVTGSSFGMTSGDFNDDGKLDVAIGGLFDSDVKVLLNEYEFVPPFTDPEFVTVGEGPSKAASGDVTGDGITDLVVSNFASGTVTVAAGVGDGTFSPSVVAASVASPGNVMLGDIDGDIDLDVLLVRTTDYVLVVLENNGAGEFVQSDQYPVALGARPALGDLDGDDDLDLAWNERLTDRFVIRFNDGDGGFGPENPYVASSTPYSVSLVDLDGDGDLDAVTPNFNPPRDVSVFLNNGSGVFAPQVKYPGPNAPIGLRAGDLDGDGDADLVVANGIDGGMGILMNNGDATFAAPVLTLGKRFLRSMELIDVDFDGSLDFLFVDAETETAVLIRNDGAGSFDSREVVLAAGQLLVDLETGDFNGDGLNDLAISDSDADGVHILLNLADPLYRKSQSVATGAGPSAVALLDVDGDDMPDLIVANEDAQTISVAHGQGDGSFVAAVSVAASASPASFALADLDGDLDVDLAHKPASGGAVSVMLNDGSGTFAFDQSYTFGAGSDGPVALGDLNGDMLPDMVSSRNGGGVSVRFNQGGAIFGSRVDSGIGGSSINAIVVANVDGDSDLDIVTAGAGANALVLLNSGTGVLSLGSTLPLSFTPYALCLGDVDGDLDPDLVLVGGDDSVALLHNNGSGVFSAFDLYHAGASPRSVALVDADLDGSLDIIIGSSASNSVSVLLNDGTGVFTCPQRFGAGAFVSGVAAADLDGDGDIDIAASAANAGGAVVLRNRTLEPSQPDPCPGNSNGDAIVDFDDINAVIANWLANHAPDTNGPGDANHDTMVNFDDISAVLTNWGQTCP